MFALLQHWKERRNRSVIEPCKKRDYSTLSEIHKASFPRGWSDGEFEALLAQGPYSCLVARKSGQAKRPPSGFVLVKTVGEEAEIITIATKRSARRKGIARQLLDAVIRQLEADRAKLLFLEVNETNQAAISLYRKFGFRQVGTRKGYYPTADDVHSNPSTALVMQLDLG